MIVALFCLGWLALAIAVGKWLAHCAARDFPEDTPE